MVVRSIPRESSLETEIDRSMAAASNKFLKHFRDLQAGESEKAGAAETLAYLNGMHIQSALTLEVVLSFQANSPFKSTKNGYVM